jgi:myo-inositol-1(or 4)-monophosphatase
MPHELAGLADLVRAAARAELGPRAAPAPARAKADGSLVTPADEAMQRRLVAALGERWPGLPVLGEEMGLAEQERALAAASRGLWVVDPIDGTSNYAAGLPYYAVSVALLREGSADLGVVHDPTRDETFAARAGGGVFLNGVPLAAPPPPPPLASALAAVDFKRLGPALATRLATAPPYGSQRSFGSVALDWCWLACGRVHLYLHGRQRLWDYAASELFFRECGGRSCTLDGEPVARPDLSPRSALAALDGRLFEAWRTWIAGPV